ncbi:hypothetical protein DESPIGER_0827 [Desulfovibrio piger]|uniref:Uncharacterized protein n=1 Tax=Desulfovibrio piger TaxID=901 RepID=A0A1K1LDA7_9BACT|nr:hypothetical protein DESPIGER_0827 [Desulfovibrio piger]
MTNIHKSLRNIASCPAGTARPLSVTRRHEPFFQLRGGKFCRFFP